MTERAYAVGFVAEVLGAMRKLPVVLLAPPSGELPPQATERAHAVGFVAEVLGAIRKLPAVLLALPLGELSPQVTERASPFYITICALVEPSVRSSCASQMQACR